MDTHEEQYPNPPDREDTPERRRLVAALEQAHTFHPPPSLRSSLATALAERASAGERQSPHSAPKAGPTLAGNRGAVALPASLPRRHTDRSRIPSLLLAAMAVFSGIAVAHTLSINPSVGSHSTAPRHTTRSPRPAMLGPTSGPTQFYDRTGLHLLAEIYDPLVGQRDPVHLAQVSSWARNAAIAVGDPLLRSNNRDLEVYLNDARYGNECTGIEAAARFYFHISAARLDLAQASLLAGLPRAPGLYEPVARRAASLSRQGVVLDAMQRAGMIDAAQKRQAVAEAQRFVFRARVFRNAWVVAPHWFYFVRDHLLNDLPGGRAQLYSGLKVITTLDFNYYNMAQSLVSQQVRRLTAQGHNVNDGAVVSIDPRTGEILCMVGSADWLSRTPAGAGQYNMATTPRQAGAVFLPFTYLTAFAQGHFPAQVIADVPARYPDGSIYYEPHNHDMKFHGAVTLRYALANQLNVPTVALLNEIGIDSMLSTVARLGMPELLDQQRRNHPFGLSVALGPAEASLLSLTNAYAAFATGGLYTPASYVRSVSDAAGRPIALLHRQAPQRAVALGVAYEMTSILSDSYARHFSLGSPSALDLSGRPAAAMGGTTGSVRDNWTIGYTPSLVTGVWVGNADYSQLYNVIGIDSAAPLWKHFMEAALGTSPREPFVPPPGIVVTSVSGYNGLLATTSTRWRIRDVFTTAQLPHRLDPGYYNPNLTNMTGEMSLNGSEQASTAPRTILPSHRHAGGVIKPKRPSAKHGRTFHSATNRGPLCDGGWYQWVVAEGGGYTITCR